MKRFQGPKPVRFYLLEGRSEQAPNRFELSHYSNSTFNFRGWIASRVKRVPDLGAGPLKRHKSLWLVKIMIRLVLKRRDDASRLGGFRNTTHSAR